MKIICNLAQNSFMNLPSIKPPSSFYDLSILDNNEISSPAFIFTKLPSMEPEIMFIIFFIKKSKKF